MSRLIGVAPIESDLRMAVDHNKPIGERYQAKNVMKQAGEHIGNMMAEKLPQKKQATGKLIDGKIYSAIIPANTEMDSDTLRKIATKLADQLIVDEAFAFAQLSQRHAVEKSELCHNGKLRVVHYFDVTTSRMIVAFEVAAGRDPEVDVEIKVTPL